MKKIIFSLSLIILAGIMLITENFNPDKIYAMGEQVSSATSEMGITSKSAILIDAESGTVMFEKDSNEKRQIASMVKLMTTLLTIENIENGNLTLEKKIIASEAAASMGGSQVFVDANAEYTVEQMLKSVIVSSANDASVVLAETLAGSESAFTAMMNKRAGELGLKDTVYVNSTGLEAPGQYSTAKNVACLLKEVIKHPLFTTYSNIWLDELVHPSGRRTELANTNRHVRYFQGCVGGKTGFTDEALFCLSSSAKRNDMTLISVVMGAKDSATRFDEAGRLLSYGFNSFERSMIVNSAEVAKNVKVLKSMTENAELYPKENFTFIIKKGEKLQFETVIQAPEKITAPVKTGETVGKIIVVKNGEMIKEIELITNADIQKITYKESLKKIVTKFA